MTKARKKTSNKAPAATPCSKCPLRKIDVFRKFTERGTGFRRQLQERRAGARGRQHDLQRGDQQPASLHAAVGLGVQVQDPGGRPPPGAELCPARRLHRAAGLDLRYHRPFHRGADRRRAVRVSAREALDAVREACGARLRRHLARGARGKHSRRLSRHRGAAPCRRAHRVRAVASFSARAATGPGARQHVDTCL